MMEAWQTAEVLAMAAFVVLLTFILVMLLVTW